MDIKETKEIVTFVVRLVSSIDSALEDGDIDFFDVDEILDPLLIAKSAFEDSKIVPQELSDLDDTEKAEIDDLVVREFSLRNKKVEGVTEDVFQIATSLAVLIKKIRQ